LTVDHRQLGVDLFNEYTELAAETPIDEDDDREQLEKDLATL
jgi:hypothetical protein